MGSEFFPCFRLMKSSHHPRLQGARPEQSQDCHQVVEMIRLKSFDQVTHTARLELKNPVVRQLLRRS